MTAPAFPGKPVSNPRLNTSRLALPNDANALGDLLGGKVMHLVDLAGAIAAIRHARTRLSPRPVDHMSFIHPVHIGQLIRLKASVNRAFRTSMEVEIKVLVEDSSPAP